MISTKSIKDAVHSIRTNCKRRRAPSSYRTKLPTLEHNLETYLHTFGQPSLEFAHVEDLFEDIYHEDFKLIEEDGQVYGKETLRQCHAHFFDLGCVADLLEFKYFGSNRAEVRFVVLSDEVDVLVHCSITIKGNQIIRMVPL